jgi:hypothetical protein
MAELVLLIMLIKQPYSEDAQEWAGYCAIAMESFEWMMQLPAASQYHSISKHFVDEWKAKPESAYISGGQVCDGPGGSNYSRVLSHRKHTNPGGSALPQTEFLNGLKVKTEPTSVVPEPVFDGNSKRDYSSFNRIPSHPNRTPPGGSLSTETYFLFLYFTENSPRHFAQESLRPMSGNPITSYGLLSTTTQLDFATTKQSSSGELDQGVLTGNEMEYGWM